MNPGNLIPRWFNVIVAITGMLTASSYRWEVAHDARAEHYSRDGCGARSGGDVCYYTVHHTRKCPY